MSKFGEKKRLHRVLLFDGKGLKFEFFFVPFPVTGD